MVDTTIVGLRTGHRLEPSPPQRPLLASQRRHPRVALQNMALLTTFDGPIDTDRLAAAFGAVVAASDVLRSSVSSDDQIELLPVGVTKPTEIIEVTDAAALRSWAEARARMPIDLHRGVYDSVVLHTADGTVSWYLALHHIATDATSSMLVTEATAAAYAGADLDLPSYYERWDHEGPDARRERAERHWYTRRPPARVGRLYTQSNADDPGSHRQHLDLGALRDEAEAVIDGRFAMLSPDLSWTTFLLTVAGAYLARISGADEFALGMPVHNRGDVAARGVIGPMMEVFPVDMAVDLDASFADLHAATARSVMTTLRNARPGTRGAASEVEAIINVIPRAGITSFGDSPATTEWIHPGAADPSHLFRLQLTPYGDAGELLLDLNHGAGTAEHRARAVGHLQAVLEAAIRRPDEAIGAVELMDADERKTIEAWGEGDVRSPATLAVPRLAEALVGRRDVAVVDGETELTGAELLRRIGRVAAWLRGQGVGTSHAPERVAVDMSRSADAIVAIHAVLQAGGSFVPLDPSQPQQRRDRLVERAGCLLTIDALPSDRALPAEPLAPHVAAPDDEAYLLFTSGSTGEPKGVPITHRGLADYLEFAQQAYVAQDLVPVAPLFSALTFDLTITTLFVPLIRNGRLVVIAENGGAGLAAIAAREDLTWMKATPSHLEILLRLGMQSPLRSLVVGGEAFLGRVARRLFRALPDVQIFNEYGPTEAVVGCMIHEATASSLGDAAEVPIGIPAPGVTLRIVDSGLADVVVGASGELLIAHDGVTSGYLDAEHDDDKFVEIEGTRFYRSGDLVRLADATTAVYQGRIDEQIKVGGIRLEPVEVEHALISHPAVARAAVRVWEPERKTAERHCVRCGLPSNVPGTEFDADGVCNSCHDYDRVKVQAEDYFRTPDDLRAVQRAARAMRSGKYDALHLLSGGKDSTYALYQLHELGFEVYSMTLDNGYISEGAKENVRQSVAELGIDHEFVTIDAMDDIFRDSLERFSNVCHGCYKTIYTVATSRADELGIPVIVTGLSRGQLFETRLIPQQFSSDRFDADAIDRAVVEARRAYHRIDDAPRRLLDTEVFDRPDDDVFSRISYVDFYRYVDVPLSEMYDYLDNNAPWVRPDDTGRSTNCLVNAAGIHSHLTEQGYHNYAMPYAWDVRLGHKTRFEAMEELDDELDMSEIGTMLGKIGFDPKPQQTLTAWIEPATGNAMPSPAEMRTYLADRIPTFAIPSAFVEVPEIPMTTNGKVDTGVLPAPTRTHRTGATVRIEPESPLERDIVATYEHVLGIDGVGVTDDFFDLGGDSLAALGLAVQLSERLERTVREEDVFTNTTARDLAAVLAASTVAVEDGPVPRAAGEPPALGVLEQGMLFEYLNDPSDSRFNTGMAFTLGRGLDRERFVAALRHVVARHVPLTWTYATPREHLPVDEAFEVQVRGTEIDDAAFRDSVGRVQRRPFDLEFGPLGRCVVQPLEGDRTGVFLSFHHISVDAGSFGVLWRQVEQEYLGEQAIELPFDYADWAAWKWPGQSGSTEPWSKDFAPGAEVRFDHGGGPSGYVAREASFSLSDLRSGGGTTAAATAMAGVAALLRNRSDGERIVLDVVTSTRGHDGSADLVGYFLNPLPVGLDVDTASTAETLAAQASAGLDVVRANRAVLRSDIVAERRRSGLKPIEPAAIFTFTEWEAFSLGPVEVRHEVLASGSPVAAASFFVSIAGNQVALGLEHDGAVIAPDEAVALLDELDAILVAMISGPADRLDSPAVDHVDPVVHGPALELPHTPTLVDTIIDAAAGGDTVAVRHGEESIDYATLLGRARSTAASLAEVGVRPGDRVAVVVERSIDQVVAVLGALLAGAAYVPIDPAYPAERRALILDDASPAAAIARKGDDLDLSWVEPSRSVSTTDWSAPTIDPESIAYVIYTSGSTGRPKGVEVRHRNIVASTLAREAVSTAPIESFLLLSSYAFDSSMVGLFGALTAGATLVLPTDEQADDIVGLADLIAEHAITDMLALPSLYRILVSEGAERMGSLRRVIVAGEACTPSVIERHHASLPHVELVNEYGPTEATVWSHSTTLRPRHDGIVPIGRPAPGARHVVLDSGGRPVGSGATGELHIGGAGITAGYLGRPDLTAERFVSLPVGEPDEVWYRTGDLVYALPDGELVFVGRTDHQLKVRGFRIEPGEIEAIAASIGGVDDVVVDVRDVSGRAQLIAWYSGSVDAAELRTMLNDRLPAHMVPATFVSLDAFPIGATGKIDRNGLTVPERTEARAPAALSDLQAEIASVWIDVLGTDEIGPDDDFFALGGDSILSMQVSARLGRLGHVVRPRTLFEHPTLRALASVLAESAPVTEVDTTPVVGLVAMTAIQRWFFDQQFEDPAHWHQTATLELAPGASIDLLIEALDIVRATHPALRARFSNLGGGWQQIIDPVPASLVHVDTTIDGFDAAVTDAVSRIDHTTGETVALVASADKVFLAVHHLVIDGVSWRVLLDAWSSAFQALSAGANGESLRRDSAPGTIREWGHAVEARAFSTDLHAEWPSGESGPRGRLADHIRVRRQLDATQTEAIVDKAAAWGRTFTIEHAVVAAVAGAVGHALDTTSVDIVLEGHGREAVVDADADVASAIGWFTSLFPVRVPATAPDSVTHQRLVFEAIADVPDRGVDFLIGRHVGGRPFSAVGDVAVNHLGDLDRAVQLDAPFVGRLELVGSVGADNHATHRVGVASAIVGGKLTIEVDHDPTLFDAKVGEKIVDDIIAALQRFVAEPPSLALRFDLVPFDEPDLRRLADSLGQLAGDRRNT